MENVIPILPCRDADAQVEFFSHLGFELVGKYIRSYLVFRRGELELHFYGTKAYEPSENPTMCSIWTDDVENLYSTFEKGLKSGFGKIPRSGFPKLTKIRELSEDWRFTLADPSGNTIYVIQPKPEGYGTFFRDIENEQCAKKVAALYDIVYSKQDMELADKVFSKIAEAKAVLGDLDRAKLLLLELEIYKDSKVKSELELLIAKNSGDKWAHIANRMKGDNPE